MPLPPLLAMSSLDEVVGAEIRGGSVLGRRVCASCNRAEDGDAEDGDGHLLLRLSPASFDMDNLNLWTHPTPSA